MEFEFYLLKIYKHSQGWRMSLCEIQNFTDGKDFSLFSIENDKEKGFELSVWS
jgi:hypothetical protein